MKLWNIKNKIAIILLVLLCQVGKTQTIDRIVAVLGDKIVRHSDVDNQVRQAVDEGINMGPNPYCTVLEEAMFQKLLVHQADVDSLEVTDEQVEAELESRIRYYISMLGSKEKFEAQYGSTVEKFKDNFRDGVRDQLKARQMQSKITSDIKVTPKEVREFFNSIPKDSMPLIGAKVEMAQLVIVPEITAEIKLAAREQLNAIRTELLEGKIGFCQAAFEYSCDPGSKNNCGEFDMIPKGTFVPEFDAVAFSMKEGEISEVFETQYGYHILELKERRGEMYRGRHILICFKVSNEQMAKASQKLDSLHQKIKSGELNFEDAVKKYSTDEETRNNGGKIFNPETGDSKFDNKEVDKQLFITVDPLEPGDISEPVYMTTPENKEGVRIIKLISRSEPHIANLRDDYPLIAEAALNDKKTKTILKWVRTKTKSMYVWVAEDLHTCPFEYPWIKKTQ